METIEPIEPVQEKDLYTETLLLDLLRSGELTEQEYLALKPN